MKSLRKLRQERNLTQTDIAHFLGIDRTTYSKYETEASDPPTATLIKLSKYFNVSVGYLVGAESEQRASNLDDSYSNEIVKLLAGASNDQLRRIVQFIRFTLSELE